MSTESPFPLLILLSLHLLLLLSVTTTSAATTAATSPPPATSPAPSPKRTPPTSTTPTPTSTSPLDPKQLSALESLNIPVPKNPCSSPARTIVCDSSKPFSHILSLTLSNCSSDVTLSNTALESLSTLTSLHFIDCPVPIVRFPSELSGNLRSLTSVNGLKKLTGVWLSRLKNLTELTVSDSNVAASGPAIIMDNMKFLQSCTLSQTNLSGFLPTHWHPNLTHVDLSGNHLKGSIPTSLTRLENLAHLNLSSNSLNDTIPTTIGNLYALQNLSLASNSFTGPIPKSLASLTGLIHLDLGSNQLNGTIPAFIGDMKKLRYLNLGNNNFRGVLPFNATVLKKLEVFKVGENANLCYNHTMLGSKMKLGIAPCDKHGLPMSPPPAKDSSQDSTSADYNDYGNTETKHHGGHGPNKVVLGFAIAISSIVFLIVFLFLCSRCCR